MGIRNFVSCHCYLLSDVVHTITMYTHISPPYLLIRILAHIMYVGWSQSHEEGHQPLVRPEPVRPGPGVH